MVPSSEGQALVERFFKALLDTAISFQTGADPVQSGLVTSLSQPGGNLTGITALAPQVVAKRLGLLHDLVPNAGLIGVAKPQQPFLRHPVEGCG